MTEHEANLVCPRCNVPWFKLLRKLMPGSEDVYTNVLMPLKPGLTEEYRKKCPNCDVALERSAV